MALTPRALEVLDYLQAKGSATPRDFLLDLDINSGSLTKRISELTGMGYPIHSRFEKHPVTGRRFKRYQYSPA